MWFFKFVTLSWILYALTQNSDALRCPRGHMVSGDRCVRCPKGYYQPNETGSQYCEPCRKCHESMGSYIGQDCTSEKNTICKCRDIFVPQENDSTTCKCPTGFTKQNNGCVKEEKKKTSTTATIHHLLTTVASLRPQGGASTQEPTTATTTTTTTTTTSHLGFPVTTKDRTRDSQSSSIVVGLVFVIVGILALTALICKQNILPRLKRRPEQSRDDSFRTPVEESGDGSHDSLKQNQEEL